MAIDINDTRGLHVGQLTRDALRNMGQPIAAADILVAWSRLPVRMLAIPATAGSEIVNPKACRNGAEIKMHDPLC